VSQSRRVRAVEDTGIQQSGNVTVEAACSPGSLPRLLMMRRTHALFERTPRARERG